MRLRPDAEGLAILEEALASGVRLIDTADVYATDPDAIGENERLVARALAAFPAERDQAVVATKGGLRREGKKWLPDGRAKHLEAACEASLRALGVDSIDLYQLHAIDPKVPAATSFRALEKLRRSGKIQRVGLSNVRLEELEAALEILPVASVQVALGPLELTPLKDGVAELCARRGIAVLAHSPLGGHRKRRRLGKSRALQAVAGRHGASVEEVALAWLLALHPSIVPLPGASRAESLRSSLRALELRLTGEDLEELALEMPAARGLRAPREERAPDPARAEGEVVLFVGYPGAGKSTLAEAWVERGYVRLNRDERGGGLADLLPELERVLSEGSRRVVLDNTYPRRASRFDVVECAWRHGVPVRCLRLETSLEDAQVNAAKRMLERYGRLLEPEEIRRDPSAVGPDALFRFRRELEEPRLGEGFTALERVAFERGPVEGRTERGLFLDARHVVAEHRDALARYHAEGYRLLALAYAPGRSDEAVREDVAERARALDLPVDVAACTHAPPAACWCRKPLPGLGVVLIERYGLDPARSLLVAASAADRGFAVRLGIPAVPQEDF